MSKWAEASGHSAFVSESWLARAMAASASEGAMAEAASCAGGSTEPGKYENYETVFTNAKAGMEAVDKEAVKKVVYEMSQGSRFFANEQRKDAAVSAKTEALRAARDAITPQQLQHWERISAQRVAELEQSRNLSRLWLHVDMDAFYAAVEALECPELATKPMAVGGLSMICTANYEARKYGVRAAMPGFIAVKLCPDLVFVRADFQKYQRYSDMSRTVFRDYDPNFVARSMDEAYLDITEACLERGLTGAQLAEELRGRVREATGGLTCSAGVGANRLLAKVCSDLNKPNGQYVLPNDRDVIMEFMATLPIRKVCGIGRVTERLLREVANITVCGQLISEAALLFALFSQISAEFFLEVGLGVGGEEPVVDEARKSVSCERTFAPLSRLPAILDKLEEIAASLEKDVRGLQLKGRTLTVKLKSTDFRTITRAISVEEPMSKKEELLPLAVRLVKAEMPLSLRLIGLRLSGLVPEGDQSLKAHGVQTKLDRFLKGPRAAEFEPRGQPAGEGNGDAKGESVMVERGSHAREGEEEAQRGREEAEQVQVEAHQGREEAGKAEADWLGTGVRDPQDVLWDERAQQGLTGQWYEEQTDSAAGWGPYPGGARDACGVRAATAEGPMGDPGVPGQLDLRLDASGNGSRESTRAAGLSAEDARQAERHVERQAAGSVAVLRQTGDSTTDEVVRDVLSGHAEGRGVSSRSDASADVMHGGPGGVHPMRHRSELERGGTPCAGECSEGAAVTTETEQHRRKKGGQTTIEAMLEGRERRKGKPGHGPFGGELGQCEQQRGDGCTARIGATSELIWLQGKGPGLALCPRCDEEFPEGKRVEHEDYHFALDLSKSEGPSIIFPNPRPRLAQETSSALKSSVGRTRKRTHDSKPAPGQKVLRLGNAK